MSVNRGHSGYVGDRFTGSTLAEPAERPVLVEDGATAHPSVESSSHPVAWKRQHNTVATALMNFTDKPNTRHELIFEINVKIGSMVSGRARPTSPVTKCGNALPHVRREGIDCWGV